MSNSNLEDHLEDYTITHSNERKFSCEICGRTFSQWANLKRHGAVHSNNRPKYRTQMSNSNSGDHLGDHTITNNERKFSCEICNKSFSQRANLKRHGAQVHSNNRPFSCSMCNKSFKVKGDLVAHMGNKHSEEKPFSCSKCGKQFTRAKIRHQHERMCKMINQPNEVKLHNPGNKENMKKEGVISQIIAHSAGKPFFSPLEHELYLSKTNDQQQNDDRVEKDDSVHPVCQGDNENEEVAETRDDEHHFDPSPSWKLWKSWDIWDTKFKTLETREDEYDFDDPPPGWRQWKNWDVWDSWKSNSPEETR